MALPEEPYTRIERYLARLSGQNVDIKDGTRFCYVTSGGGADSYSPSASGGVRPYFLIA